MAQCRVAVRRLGRFLPVIHMRSRVGPASSTIDHTNGVHNYFYPRASEDGRIHIEKINGPFLYRERGTTAEYKAGLDLAIERGWLALHESGTFVRFTQAGAELFA